MQNREINQAEIRNRIMQIKLEMIKKIHETTLKALATSDIESLDAVLDERGAMINKLNAYQKKLNYIQKVKNFEIKYTDAFTKKYNGYVKALMWNSQSLSKRLNEEKKKITGKIGQINKDQNIMKYVRSGMKRY